MSTNCAARPISMTTYCSGLWGTMRTVCPMSVHQALRHLSELAHTQERSIASGQSPRALAVADAIAASVTHDAVTGTAPQVHEGAATGSRNAKAAGAPPLVLVVEDDEFQRKLLKRLLRGSGMDVSCVASGGQALAAAGTDKPDLIVLDINLPDIDGISVVRQLKADAELRRSPRDHGYRTQRQGCGDRKPKGGGVRVLVKPFTQKTLRAKIRACLPKLP